jgi:hypothetical protein
MVIPFSLSLSSHRIMMRRYNYCNPNPIGDKGSWSEKKQNGKIWTRSGDLFKFLLASNYA